MRVERLRPTTSTAARRKPPGAAEERVPGARRPLAHRSARRGAEPSELVVSPAASVFYKGENRFPFGVFHKDRSPVTDAQVALYFAPSPRSTRKPKKRAPREPTRRAQIKALEEPATGPFPAKVESLATQPAFRAQTTADDPDAATVVYSTQIDFPKDGEWRIAAVIKEGDELTATLLSSVIVGASARAPGRGAGADDPHADRRRMWAATSNR